MFIKYLTPPPPPLYHSVCNTMSNCQFTFFVVIKRTSFTVEVGGALYTHTGSSCNIAHTTSCGGGGVVNYDITYCSMWVDGEMERAPHTPLQTTWQSDIQLLWLASFPGSQAREREHWSCGGDTYSRSRRAWERGYIMIIQQSLEWDTNPPSSPTHMLRKRQKNFSLSSTHLTWPLILAQGAPVFRASSTAKIATVHTRNW